MKAFFLLILLSISSFLLGEEVGSSPKKVLICGVCQNVSEAADNTIHNIEKLGTRFTDYRVIIYENNSTDSTKAKFSAWAKKNPRVVFLSKKVPKSKLAASRTERIADARNCVLEEASQPLYQDYEILIMADLDFKKAWPIDAILQTLNSPKEWDCVSANGVVTQDKLYHDYYALREPRFPLGPEMLGDKLWGRLMPRRIRYKGNDWRTVYSAFGGLAIYKTAVITRFRYSGTVTEDLKERYRTILRSLPSDNPFMEKYRQLNRLGPIKQKWPIAWRMNMVAEHPTVYNHVTCCEHVPLHASMALQGFDKMFINPKMYMEY